MINTLILLIDNEQIFLNDFISMALDTPNILELAEMLECWFTDALEYEKAIVTSHHPSLISAKSYQHVFQSILATAIENVSEQDWIFLAEHYQLKAAESQQ